MIKKLTTTIISSFTNNYQDILQLINCLELQVQTKIMKNSAGGLSDVARSV
jgi:hypothetical protein